MSALEFELILPCYNEGKSLESLLKRCVSVAQNQGFTADRFQLVLVENGSKDNSFAVMEELKKGTLGPWFRVVRVELNQGYGFGLWSGLQTSSAPYVGWSHADQQCDPNDAFIALDELKKSSDQKTLVKGVRYGRNWKDITVSRVFDSFARVLLGIPAYEINAQPKVFPRALLAEIKDPPKDFAFDIYVLYRAHRNRYTIKTIPVKFPPRVHGLSNWASSFAGRYKTILNMIRYMRRLSKSEGRL